MFCHSQYTTVCNIEMLSSRLTHWGWVTHKCICNLTIVDSDNSLSRGRRQAIIWINAGILSIRTLGTNFSEILIYIDTFSFKKMYLKMSSGKRRPFSFSLNVLTRPVFSKLQCVPHRSLLIRSYGMSHILTLKHWETHGCVVSTVATDALVLKHQAISIHNADLTFIALDQFHIKILHIRWTASENEITFWKKWPSRLRVKLRSVFCINLCNVIRSNWKNLFRFSVNY